jgi:hypothetical protein
MTLKDFTDMLIVAKNSLGAFGMLSQQTSGFWYENYFKHYQQEDLQKVLNYMTESNIPLTLPNFLQAIKEFQVYLLHEEIKYCLDIMKQAKAENIEIRAKSYPKLSRAYRLPASEAWDIAFKLNGGK